jgi:hypothetical protein
MQLSGSSSASAGSGRNLHKAANNNTPPLAEASAAGVSCPRSPVASKCDRGHEFCEAPTCSRLWFVCGSSCCFCRTTWVGG